MCVINTQSICYERVLSVVKIWFWLLFFLSPIYLGLHLYFTVRYALAYCSALAYLALSWAITVSCSCDRWDQISLPHVIPLTLNRGRLFIAPLHANLTLLHGVYIHFCPCQQWVNLWGSRGLAFCNWAREGREGLHCVSVQAMLLLAYGVEILVAFLESIIF